MRKMFWSMVTLALACATASAADVRRVVTGLDAANKAGVLFDARLTLNPGKSGNPAANVWITDSSPPGFSAGDQPCLDQSRQGAVPHHLCFDGFEAAVMRRLAL